MSPESNATNRMLDGPLPADTLDIREVAAALKCHPTTIRRLIQAGRFPRPIRVGAALRVRRADLREWMEAGGSIGPKVESRTAGVIHARHGVSRLAPTLRSGADGRPVLTGYGAVFYDGTPETEYELAPGVFERVSPTAFARALSERADVVCAFNHNPDYLLGRTSSGTLKLSVDAKGLAYEIALPDTQAGRDVWELARRGDLQGSSFQFVTRKEREYTDGGRLIRELTDVLLIELGPVWSPAYRGATAGVAGAVGAAPRSRSDADADLVAVQLAVMGMDEDELPEPVRRTRRQLELEQLSARCRALVSAVDQQRIATLLGSAAPRCSRPAREEICDFCGEEFYADCLCG